MLTVLGLGPNSELETTLNKYSDQKDRLKNQLKKFIEFKNEHPFNGAGGGVMGFGDNDKKFKTSGVFGNVIPGISHAHLTHNLSVVYKLDREKNILNIYGIYSHDDIGTGNPPNIQKQNQAATRWSNLKLSVNDLSILDKNKKVDVLLKPNTAKIDYTPKAKIDKIDPLVTYATNLDKMWPQRNFLERFMQSKLPVEHLRLINSEMAYLDAIKNRYNLYKNQLDYAKGLEALYWYLTSKNKPN